MGLGGGAVERGFELKGTHPPASSLAREGERIGLKVSELAPDEKSPLWKRGVPELAKAG